jgi:hypothetical protein
MPDPNPTDPAPRRRRPTILLLMALVALVASLLAMLKQEEDASAQRRKAALEVEDRLAHAAAEAPRIRKERAALDTAENLRVLERFEAVTHAFLAKDWARLAERARGAKESEIGKLIREAERLAKNEAEFDAMVEERRRRAGRRRRARPS